MGFKLFAFQLSNKLETALLSQSNFGEHSNLIAILLNDRLEKGVSSQEPSGEDFKSLPLMPGKRLEKTIKEFGNTTLFSSILLCSEIKNLKKGYSRRTLQG